MRDKGEGRGRLTISRSNVGYMIESNTPTGSGESRGEGAAHECGSARVEKARLRREQVRWIEEGVKDKRRVLEGVHHDEATGEGGEGKKGKKDVVTATRTVLY